MISENIGILNTNIKRWIKFQTNTKYLMEEIKQIKGNLITTCLVFTPLKEKTKYKFIFDHLNLYFSVIFGI